MTGELSAETLRAIEASGGFAPLWELRAFEEELSHPSSRLVEWRATPESPAEAFLFYRVEDDEAWIMHLATARKGQGLGKRLLSSALARMRHEGLTSAWLEVGARNEAALRLYRSAGFRETGIRKAYYRNGDDAIVMHLRFGGNP